MTELTTLILQSIDKVLHLNARFLEIFKFAMIMSYTLEEQKDTLSAKRIQLNLTDFSIRKAIFEVEKHCTVELEDKNLKLVTSSTRTTTCHNSFKRTRLTTGSTQS